MMVVLVVVTMMVVIMVMYVCAMQYVPDLIPFL